jgi:CubicO group peptidase (beta-lactamase class C family)
MTLTFQLLAASPILASPASPGTSPGNSFEKIDAFVQQQMDRLRIPGVALAIVQDDKIVHQRGFGVARPQGEVPSPKTPFVLGSTTKSFTALAVMQLVEVGRIDLDAPVQRYLPWFRVADLRASAQMTVRHLLNQTSGLSLSCGWIPLADFDQNSDAGERQSQALATLPLSHPVGSAFEYSNMNYNLLGLIVEAASGEPYATYIQDHVFAPLDMRYSYTTRTEAARNGLAAGYRYWFASPVAVPNLPLPRGSLPSGQLISSSEDMAHYLIAQLNDGRYGNVQVLSPAGVAKMHRPAVNATMMGAPIGKYGMGWFTEEIGNTRLTYHSGTVPDYFSFMALLPEQRKGVVLLVNADHWMMNMALMEVGMGAAILLADHQPAPSRFAAIPWMMQALLLIPILQAAGVLATLFWLRRWRRQPDRRPGPGRMWGIVILLPLIPNLAVALSLLIPTGSLGGFFWLFMPDLSWFAVICGSAALAWIFVRTALILWTLRRSSSSPVRRRGRYSSQIL